MRVKRFHSAPPLPVVQQMFSAGRKAFGGGAWGPYVPGGSGSPGMPGASRDTEQLEQPYIQAPWVAAATDFFSLTNALVRPRVWDRDPDDPAAIEIVDGPVMELLNRIFPTVNPVQLRILDAQNISLFNESIHFLMDGNGNPVSSIGDGPDAFIELPASFVPVRGTIVGLEVDTNTSLPKFWLLRTGKGQIKWPVAAAVVHGEIPDPFRPYRFISRMAKAWGPANARYLANRFQGFLLKNAGDPGGMISVPGTLSYDEVHRMKEELAESWGDPESAGDYRLMWGDAKMTQGNRSPRDLEWPMVHDLSKQDISAVFQTPAALLGSQSENFATFKGHWQTYIQLRAGPWFKADAMTWNTSFFKRLRNPTFQKYRLRYDTEVLDQLFADLGEQGSNAKTFFGMGMPLNESLRQVGIKTDPIEGGDVPMINQGILPFQASITIGKALAAQDLINLGVPRKAALEEAGLGHLPVENRPSLEPPKPPPGEGGDKIPKPDNGANHDDETDDRKGDIDDVLKGMDGALQQLSEDGDRVMEWRHVQSIQAKHRRSLDGGLKRIFTQMKKAQLRALEEYAETGSVTLGHAFGFRRCVAKGSRSGHMKPVYAEYPFHVADVGENLWDALQSDLAEERDMQAAGDERLFEDPGCCGPRVAVVWRPRLAKMAKDPEAQVQQLEDLAYMHKAQLTEEEIEALIVVTSAKFTEALTEKILASTTAAFEASIVDIAAELNVVAIDIADPAVLRSLRLGAIQVAEGVQSTVAKRLRSDIIKFLAEKPGTISDLQQIIHDSLKDLKAEVTRGFKDHHARALAIARTEVGRATNEARYEQLLEAFREKVIDIIEWLTSQQDNVRDSHRTMHGQGRVPGTPFLSGGGVLLQRPHDPAAPAKEVVNCNCTLRGRRKKEQS